MKRLIRKLMNQNSLGSDELMLLGDLRKGVGAATILPGAQTYYQAHDEDGWGLVIGKDLDHVKLSVAEHASVEGVRAYDYLRVLTVTDGFLTHVDGQAICAGAHELRAQCVSWEWAMPAEIVEPVGWLLDWREKARLAQLEVKSLEKKIAQAGGTETLSKKLTSARAWLAECNQNLEMMARAQVMVFGSEA